MKNVIINVRGTSGSGKSTLIRQLLNTYGILENLGKTGYILNKNIAVVGKYDNPCGGCDTMKNQQDIMDAVKAFYAQGYNVIFEGLMISTVHSTWVEFAKEFGENFHVVYLNTSVEQCLQNIETRRSTSGKTYNKPLNVDNIVGKHKSINFQHTKQGFVNKYSFTQSQAYEFIRDICKQD